MLNRLNNIVKNNLASNDRYVMMGAFATPLFAIAMMLIVDFFKG